MKYALAVLLLFGCIGAAQADIWKWVDANGEVHFVNSLTPIYTWTDETGRVFYSDTPGHEDAVSVELIWVSGGDLEDVEPEHDSALPISGGRIFAEESREEIEARAQQRKEFCDKAKAVYDSYIKAPRLYTTDDKGKRVYLSSKEATRIIQETKAKRDDACS